MATKLNTLNWGQLREEEVLEFGRELEKIISGLGGASLFGADASRYTVFRKDVAALDEALKHIAKNVMTAELQKLDRERDAAYTAVREEVRAAFKFPGAASFHEKAAAVQAVVDAYHTRKSLTYNEETAVIHNIIQDFDAAPVKGYITDLQIPQNRIDRLAELNNAFEKLYIERVKAEAVKTRYDVQELRKALKLCVADVVENLVAGAARETYKGKFVEFINDYNELVAKYKAVIDRRRAAYLRRKEKGEAVEDENQD